jgi:hypothetical protein
MVMYRNPVEQWLWESGVMGWGLGLIAMGIILAGVVAVWKEMRK